MDHLQLCRSTIFTFPQQWLQFWEFHNVNFWTVSIQLHVDNMHLITEYAINTVLSRNMKGWTSKGTDFMNSPAIIRCHSTQIYHNTCKQLNTVQHNTRHARIMTCKQLHTVQHNTRHARIMTCKQLNTVQHNIRACQNNDM